MAQWCNLKCSFWKNWQKSFVKTMCSWNAFFLWNEGLWSCHVSTPTYYWIGLPFGNFHLRVFPRTKCILQIRFLSLTGSWVFLSFFFQKPKCSFNRFLRISRWKAFLEWIVSWEVFWFVLEWTLCSDCKADLSWSRVITIWVHWFVLLGRFGFGFHTMATYDDRSSKDFGFITLGQLFNKIHFLQFMFIFCLYIFFLLYKLINHLNLLLTIYNFRTWSKWWVVWKRVGFLTWLQWVKEIGRILDSSLMILIEIVNNNWVNRP